MVNLIAQAIGIAGIVLCILCYHGRNRKEVLGIKLAADVMWMIHYLMIGAHSAMAVNIVCGIREMVYLLDGNKKRRIFWLSVFMAANWAAAAFTWTDAAGLLPALAMTIATYSFWQKNINMTRGLALAVAAAMMTYDVFVGSYAGLANEALTVLSTGIALYRGRAKTT